MHKALQFVFIYHTKVFLNKTYVSYILIFIFIIFKIIKFYINELNKIYSIKNKNRIDCSPSGSGLYYNIFLYLITSFLIFLMYFSTVVQTLDNTYNTYKLILNYNR